MFDLAENDAAVTDQAVFHFSIASDELRMAGEIIREERIVLIRQIEVNRVVKQVHIRVKIALDRSDISPVS